MLSSHAWCWVSDLSVWRVRIVGLLAPHGDAPPLHFAAPEHQCCWSGPAGKNHPLLRVGTKQGRTGTWQVPGGVYNSRTYPATFAVPGKDTPSSKSAWYFLVRADLERVALLWGSAGIGVPGWCGV